MLDNEISILQDLQNENIDKNYHWVLKLIDYPNHPFKQLLKEFTPNTRQLFQTSYLYIGETYNFKTICILHYHSNLNGPILFMNMQNLESYKNMELSTKDINLLSKDITRDTVIDLSKSEALTNWHLDKILTSHYFYITDETGFVKKYELETWG